VGEVDLELQMGMAGELKQPIKKDLKNVQDSLAKVNRSIERVERSISRRDLDAPQPKKRYESLKLPEIKDPKQERLKKLAKMLQLKQSIDLRNKKKRRVES
jgi:sensor domain CHASE-containing protein